MKNDFKSLLLMLVAVMSVTMFVACSKDKDEEPQPEPEKTYNLTGKVVNKYNKQPVVGATVTIAYTHDKTVTQKTTTDENGLYRFAKVKEGFHNYTCEKEKFFTHTGVLGVWEQSVEFDIDLSKDPAAYPPSTDELVDLGLSVKWASCNIGADAPEKTGGFYAWGELETKEDYSEETSLYYKVEMPDISGNPDYDVAAFLTEGKMRLPNEKEASELAEKCEKIGYIYNGVVGDLFIGPNEKSIFMPRTGVMLWKTLVVWPEPLLSCWTSTPKASDTKKNEYSYEFGTSVGELPRIYGLQIRPVGK